MIIEGEGDLSVCGEASDIQGALASCDANDPDLALIDISLKGEDGLDIVKKMRSHAPSVRTAVFSLHDEAIHIERAREAGAGGYALKSDGPRKLLECIRHVLAGKQSFPLLDPS